MDINMVDATSVGALMEKALVATRDLISNMVENSQQHVVRNLRRVVQKVQTHNVDATENLRLENKLNELTSMVRQLVIGQLIILLMQALN